MSLGTLVLGTWRGSRLGGHSPLCPLGRCGTGKLNEHGAGGDGELTKMASCDAPCSERGTEVAGEGVDVLASPCVCTTSCCPSSEWPAELDGGPGGSDAANRDSGSSARLLLLCGVVLLALGLKPLS